MVELWKLTNTDASLTEINTNLQLFTGYVMLASAITILVSYKCMRDSFIKSTNLRGSQYKDSLQNGFLIITLAYIIRSAYSISYAFRAYEYLGTPKNRSFWVYTV